MASTSRTKVATALVVVATVVVLGACSGGGVRGRHASAAGVPGSSEGFPSDDPGTPSSAPPSGTPSDSPLREGAIQPSSLAAPPGAAASQPLQIFGPREDRIGLTSTNVSLCEPAPWNLLRLDKVSDPADVNVYWDTRNAGGGIHGRTITAQYPDDADTDAVAQQVFEQCVNEYHAFFTIGGTLDLHIINLERQWAEQDRTMYWFAFGNESPRRTFSYSGWFSTEQLGRFMAEWMLRAHHGQRIGVVYCNEPTWEPARATFAKTLAAHGVRVAAEVGVARNQGQYGAEIAKLQGHVDTVAVLFDFFNATTMIRQAVAANFKTRWVLPTAANFTTDTLGRDATDPYPIEALTTWPVYRPGDYSDYYGAEVKRFEQAFRRVRQKDNVSEVPWIAWLTEQAFGSALDACGRDCTRNKFLAVRDWAPNPLCPAHFALGANFGGTRASMALTFLQRDGTTAWKMIPGTICAEHF